MDVQPEQFHLFQKSFEGREAKLPLKKDREAGSFGISDSSKSTISRIEGLSGGLGFFDFHSVAYNIV
jgi:hypothetical protein